MLVLVIVVIVIVISIIIIIKVFNSWDKDKSGTVTQEEAYHAVSGGKKIKSPKIAAKVARMFQLFRDNDLNCDGVLELSEMQTRKKKVGGTRIPVPGQPNSGAPNVPDCLTQILERCNIFGGL